MVCAIQDICDIYNSSGFLGMEHGMPRTSLIQTRAPARLSAAFALTGGVMWLCAAVFITAAFGPVLDSTDFVLMHHQKLQMAVGIGLAATGSMFLGFAALIAVMASQSRS
jgi:hypothetical protein